MKPLYTTIPIKLCEYAVLNRKINQLALFLYLKHNSDGEIDFDKSSYKHYAVDIGKSEKWVRNTMDWFIEQEWITVNSKRNILRIISYKNLCIKLNISNCRSAIYENEDFRDFKGFCCAVVIANLISIKRYIEKKGWSVSIMGDAFTNHPNFYKGFYTMPIFYLALRLKISPSRANNIKKAAEKWGYLEVKKQIIVLRNDKGEKVSKNLFNSYQLAFPEEAGRYRQGKKYLRRVEADIMRAEVIIKSKRL